MKKVYKVVSVEQPISIVNPFRTSCIIASGANKLYYSTSFWTKSKRKDRGVYCFDNIRNMMDFIRGTHIIEWEVWEVYYRKCKVPIQAPLRLGWDTNSSGIIFNESVSSSYNWPPGTVECKRVKLKKRIGNGDIRRGRILGKKVGF